MRSKENIEVLVRKEIENLTRLQRGYRYELEKKDGETCPTIKKNFYQGRAMMDVEEQKSKLLSNFDETVKLIIVREIGELLTVLREKANMDPEVSQYGIGTYCRFTIEDIQNLNLDDPDFVNENFEEILQTIYESYGYENQLHPQEEIEEKKEEAAQASKEGVKRSEMLKLLKESAMMEHERGQGTFTMNGLPWTLSEDCAKNWDRLIREEIEREESKQKTEITGQDLGEETIQEQKDTSAKQEAMNKLNILRQRLNDKQLSQ